jgi:hypothetical protein
MRVKVFIGSVPLSLLGAGLGELFASIRCRHFRQPALESIRPEPAFSESDDNFRVREVVNQFGAIMPNVPDGAEHLNRGDTLTGGGRFTGGLFGSGQFRFHRSIFRFVPRGAVSFSVSGTPCPVQLQSICQRCLVLSITIALWVKIVVNR